MFQAIYNFITNIEPLWKVETVMNRIINFFVLKSVPIVAFKYQLINKEDLCSEDATCKKLCAYELLRTSRLFRITLDGSSIHLKKILQDLGLTPEVFWATSKHSDFTAAKNLKEPRVYLRIKEKINGWLRKIPIIDFQLPGFGRERLHIRAFQDKEKDCWYLTAHIDRTNLFSPDLSEFGRMLKTHAVHLVEGDYKLGTELFNDMLSSYTKKNNILV